MTLLGAVPEHADVVAVAVDGETVVFRAADSSLHKLDGVASVVWQLLDGTATVQETVDDLVAVYRAPVDVVGTDVVRLVEMLLEQGLLRLVGPVPPEVAPRGQRWSASEG